MNARDARDTRDWLDRRGLAAATPESLNASLRAVLENVPNALYGAASAELTAAELDVLREGGVDFERPVTRDPFAATAVLFAALLESSLSTVETAKRLDMAANQVRQMIARRTLYSIKLDERRHVPQFQFRRGGALVPNITRVNPVLPSDLHPVEVYDWYTVPEPDLAVGDGDARALSPLEWLDTGGDPARVVAIARRL